MKFIFYVVVFLIASQSIFSQDSSDTALMEYIGLVKNIIKKSETKLNDISSNETHQTAKLSQKDIKILALKE